MRTKLRCIYFSLVEFGFNPASTFKFIIAIPSYIKDLCEIRKQIKKSAAKFRFGPLCLMLTDKYQNAGISSGHYFHQDLLIANKIFKSNPKKHVDIGSRVDGFIAHVASFREIEVFDIRPMNKNINNIKFTKINLMKLPKNLVNYCDSISSLHAIEHFGLGRYNDPVDINGYIKALNNIYRILKKGGKFYFSVPIGKQRIEFNAHRVFNLGYLLNLIGDKYKIDSFSYVDDRGNLHINASLDNKNNVECSFNCNYGCAIFEMTKI